jgi:hypothetical protein
LHNFGIDSQFLGLASSLIRNLWNQIAATRQDCPWILITSTRESGAAAQRRAEILSELPSGERIRDAMAALGVGRTTLFRWLQRFREWGAGQPNRGRLARQFHKLCSNPKNFGSFRPMNCESIPKLCTLRTPRALNPKNFGSPTADLSGNLTADRPGKSDASERRCQLTVFHETAYSDFSIG